MSRDSSTSGMRGNPACIAWTWGAKVKGTSPRRSGRVEAASTAELGPAINAVVGEAVGRFVSMGWAGVGQDDFDGCTMTFVERCAMFMDCIFRLCSSTVSPTITKPPSASFSAVDFFESLRSPRKLNMIICRCVLSWSSECGHKLT